MAKNFSNESADYLDALGIDFHSSLHPNLFKGFVKSLMYPKEKATFTISRTFSEPVRSSGNFFQVENSWGMHRIKLSFQLRRCVIDSYSGYCVEALQVMLYDWRSKARSRFMVKNAALMHKIIRVCSLASSNMVATEIQGLLIQPHTQNVPFGYRSPKSIKEKLEVNNSYFSEKLLTFLINKQLTLNGFRFGKTVIKQPQELQRAPHEGAGHELRRPKDEILYTKYSGTVSGFAKVQELYPDYSQLNQLDLNVMSQELLKYRLITGGLDKDSSIKRMSNIRHLEYMIRRDIIGLGQCDIKLEIYLSQYLASNTQGKGASVVHGDQSLTASAIENFYSILSTRIMGILKFELAKMGMIDSRRDLISEYSTFLGHKHAFLQSQNQEIEARAPLGLSISRSRRALGEPPQRLNQLQQTQPQTQSRTNLVPVETETEALNANPLGLLAGLFSSAEPAPAPSSSQASLLLPPKSATPGQEPLAHDSQLSKVLRYGKFFRKFVEMHRRLGQSKQVISQKMASPKIFHDHETVMFLLRVAPVGNRISTHKIILSSADIVNLFEIGDFLTETLHKNHLDLDTIAWIGSLEPKVVFNHLCNYICSKLIMRKWMSYSRLFLFSFSSPSAEEPDFYQNDFMWMQIKTTPKIQPFLRAQSLDYDCVYHRTIRTISGHFGILSIIRRTREKMLGVKFYVQRHSRTYYANLLVADVSGVIKGFIRDVMEHLIRVQGDGRIESFEGLLSVFRRRQESPETPGMDSRKGSPEKGEEVVRILGLDKYKFMEFFKNLMARPKSAVAQPQVGDPMPGISLQIPAMSKGGNQQPMGHANVEELDEPDDVEEDPNLPKKVTSRYMKPRSPTLVFSKDYSESITRLKLTRSDSLASLLSIKLPRIEKPTDLTTPELLDAVRFKSHTAFQLLSTFETKLLTYFGLEPSLSPASQEQKSPDSRTARKISLLLDELQNYFSRIESSLLFAFWQNYFQIDVATKDRDAIVKVEDQNLILYNLVSEKFLEIGPRRTGKVDVYLFQKPDKFVKEVNSGGVSLFSSFTPISYSATSNYLMELIYYTSGETQAAPYKASYKAINLREVINLRNAMESGGKTKSMSETRVFYGDIRNLGFFLADQVQTTNIMEHQDNEIGSQAT